MRKTDQIGMNKDESKKIVMGLGLVGLGILTFGQTAQADTTDSHAMYRLYNPNSGEHFYTGSSAERKNLVMVGWLYEGIGWYSTSGQNGMNVICPSY